VSTKYPHVVIDPELDSVLTKEKDTPVKKSDIDKEEEVEEEPTAKEDEGADDRPIHYSKDARGNIPQPTPVVHFLRQPFA